MTTTARTIDAFLRPHIEALAHQGHDVWVACSFEPQIAGPASNLDLDDVRRRIPVPFDRRPIRWGNLRALGRVRALFASEPIDLVSVHTPVAAAVVRLAAACTPRHTRPKISYFAHGFHFTPESKDLRARLFRLAEFALRRFTDHFIVINKTDESWLMAHPPRASVDLIQGVGVPPCDHEDSPGQEPRRGLRLLGIGELAKEKRWHDAIEAVARTDGVSLVIAGEGRYRGALEAQIEELGVQERVQLLGYRTDVGLLLHACDVLVHPSGREGLPRAVMEAMTCGVPVIAADVRGCRDLLGEQRGVLLPVGEPLQLSSVLERLCRGQLDLGPNARRASDFAQRHLMTDHVVAEFVTALERQMGLR